MGMRGDTGIGGRDGGSEGKRVHGGVTAPQEGELAGADMLAMAHGLLMRRWLAARAAAGAGLGVSSELCLSTVSKMRQELVP